MPASGANSNPTASALPLANTRMNRMVSKQLLQAGAVGLFRLIRPAGVNEVLTVLMAEGCMPVRQWCGIVRVRYSPEVGVNILVEDVEISLVVDLAYHPTFLQ